MSYAARYAVCILALEQAVLQHMAIPLSILDQSPVLSGSTPADAVAATIELARHAERLGYARFWLSEHHAMAGLADASPEILLARLTAETQRIRLGTGGIMLPHHAALKVAESFRMLEALAPGRIDLGVGRAPGGTGLVSVALESRNAADFPGQIEETIAFMRGDLPAQHPFARLVAMPSGERSPDVWILGSSEYGALLAAEMGLPYAYAHFIGGDAQSVMHAYRARFRSTPERPEPRSMIALTAIAAPTEAEAEALALPVALWRMRLLRGHAGPVPSVAEAEAYPWTPLERHEVARTRRALTGTPETVRAGIEALVASHAADEAMIVTIVPDTASRLRSYELLADAFSLAAVAA